MLRPETIASINREIIVESTQRSAWTCSDDPTLSYISFNAALTHAREVAAAQPTPWHVTVYG